MRIFLLPISTRRTLIYCKHLNVATVEKQTYVDKTTEKATKMWASWEQKESGWQKKVVEWGNQAMKRIPFEEWGLKSLPPMSKRKDSKNLTLDDAMVEVLFPSIIIPKEKVHEVLHKIGTEREALHKKRMMWCFVGMPISAPAALVPIVPNLPFFYLVYRAWSHYRALAGSKHIQYLLKENLCVPNPSPILDTLYSAGIMKATRGSITLNPNEANASPGETTPLLDDAPMEPEVLLLGKGDSARIARALEMPELHAELDRAIWQVERALGREKELKGEIEEMARAVKEEEEKAKKAGSGSGSGSGQEKK